MLCVLPLSPKLSDTSRLVLAARVCARIGEREHAVDVEVTLARDAEDADVGFISSRRARPRIYFGFPIELYSWNALMLVVFHAVSSVIERDATC